MQYLSSGAYEALTESGIIKLPSQRTLRDYTHHIEAAPGFSTDTDILLMKAAEIDVCPDRDRNVLLLIDEMYIKEGLVYDKHKGNFIGFCNLGSINRCLETPAMIIGYHYHSVSFSQASTELVFQVTNSTLGYYWCEISSAVNVSLRPSIITPVLNLTSLPECTNYSVQIAHNYKLGLKCGAKHLPLIYTRNQLHLETRNINTTTAPNISYYRSDIIATVTIECVILITLMMALLFIH